jgi:hypothetical protein
MTKYRYEGQEELVFPTLGLTIKNGDEFEGPEGLTLNKLVVADSKKSKIATDQVAPSSEPIEVDSVITDSEGE